MNCRSLSPLTDDPTDCSALTTTHFVLVCPGLSLPESSIIGSNNAKWKLLNQLREDFWKQWSKDYLYTLQMRNKWKKPVDNIQVGSIVLILSDNTPPSQWPLAIVTPLHTGNDGLVQTVKDKIATSLFNTPIAKLFLLTIQFLSQFVNIRSS